MGKLRKKENYEEIEKGSFHLRPQVHRVLQ